METLGRGNQNVAPRMLFSPKMKGKAHRGNAATGVGFPQIENSIRRKGERQWSQPVTPVLAKDVKMIKA